MTQQLRRQLVHFLRRVRRRAAAGRSPCRRRRLLLECLESRQLLEGSSIQDAMNSAAFTVNDPPSVVNPIADIHVDEDASDPVIDLEPVFTDPDLGLGDALTYTATVTLPIDSLVAQIRQSSYTTLHQDLLYTHTGDNRGVGGWEHGLAQDNIHSYFAGLGLETAQEPFVYNSQTYYNVVGVYPGVTRPNDVYLVGAHYDSVNNPGADDNASGVAAVMELARVMTQYEFDATLVFVAFDREEQGLHGSKAYANAHAGDDIRGMLSLDMIAYNIPGPGHDTVRFYDWNGAGRIKSDLAAAFAVYSGGLATVDSGAEYGSDHYWFEQKGFDAALVIEYAVRDNPYYHRAGDAVETADYIDYDYATKITRGVMGYLATAAGLASPSDLLTATINGQDLILDYTAGAHGIADVCIRATDSQELYADDTFRVTVTPVNDAPVLAAEGTMALNAIDQDEAFNPGTLVRDILAGGGAGVITDADWGELPGIAVTAVDSSHGTWQYTVNNGLVWHALGEPTAASARLLGSDAGTRIRFQPAALWHGTVDPGLTFRAWDHTQGFNGQTADASSGDDPIAFSAASETASLTVQQTGGPRIDLTVAATPTATEASGEVLSLPGSVAWVHEWEPFWVETWGSTWGTATQGVGAATVDLQYDTSYLTALEIEHGPAFAQHRTGTIDDSLGVVSAIGGSTELTDVGDDGYVLLARVRFASTANDQVPVDPPGRNIGPYDMQLALTGAQAQLVGGGLGEPALGEPPATELWAVVYDMDDNNRLDFGDFSYFAAAFGRDVELPGSEPPFVWWADFDRSGQVDFGDLAFFAANFGKSFAGGEPLVFPSNFPSAWLGGAGDGQTLAFDADASAVLLEHDAPLSIDVVQAAGAILNVAPTVGVQVVAVPTPSAAGSTALPSSLAAVTLGNAYFVEVWVQDQLTPGTGISGGSVDVGYATAVVDAVSLLHQDFGLFPEGTIDDASGVVRNLSGGTLLSGLGIAPHWARLGYVQVLATGVGDATFDLSTGLLQFSRYGTGNVDWSLVDLGTAIMVAQLATSWQNPIHPCDVTDDGNITPLDVLVAINEINTNGVRQLPVPPQPPQVPPPYCDVSGDGWLTAIDVLVVINYLNAHDSGPVPGASSAAPPMIANASGDDVNGEGSWAEREAEAAARTVGEFPDIAGGVLGGRDASPRLWPWLASEDRESVGAQLGEGSRRLPGSWEPLEDLLTLLAEHASDRLLGDALEPRDALFARAGW